MTARDIAYENNRHRDEPSEPVVETKIVCPECGFEMTKDGCDYCDA